MAVALAAPRFLDACGIQHRTRHTGRGCGSRLAQIATSFAAGVISVAMQVAGFSIPPRTH
jgi:hypothetical protein